MAERATVGVMHEASETWEHAGLSCELRPTPVPVGGPFNGYVRVPSSHPYAGRNEDDVPVRVHGGLTYAETDEDGSTLFGWDDCHAWPCERGAKEETNSLAEQLAALV